MPTGEEAEEEEEEQETPLLDILRTEIATRGPISFARFMEQALYHPRYGYYTTGAPFGPGGDFVTASDVGREFGRCMARQLVEADAVCGSFDPCDVIEVGGGRGLLARDILDCVAELAPDLARRLRYTLCDRSPGLRASSREVAPEARVISPERMEGGGQGFVLAVELFDALPVHRVRRMNGRLMEVVVAQDASGDLVEELADAPAEVVSWAELYGAAVEEGTEAEVSLQLSRELERLASWIDRGFLIIVDYGDRKDRLYSERPRGTLLAYRGHTVHEGVLENAGTQDLTAHVNFSALEDAAKECGLEVLGLTTQDRFLIGNGLVEVFEAEVGGDYRDPAQVKRRMQALQLMHPLGMGRAFKVLILGKGRRAAETLSGLRDPFTRD